MKKFLKFILVGLLSLGLLAGCSAEDGPAENGNKDQALKVVTSFTIIEDIAREIGGDYLEINNLVPTGTDPHEYEPLPEDIKNATDADVLFYNGLNLEGGKDGWFFKMIESVGQDEDKIFSLTERVEPMYLTSEDGQEEEINPHSFIDPAVGIKMAEDMRDALMETVSKETGIRMSERPIYSDEIGKPGEEVDIYIKYLKYNINLIHDELKADS